MPAAAGYVYDPLYLQHDVAGHPEGAGRLRAIMGHLEESGTLSKMSAVGPRDATEDDLLLVHDSALIARVRQTSDRDLDWLDLDTYAVRSSYAAALRSAGGVLAGTDAVVDGDLASVFCLVRPPGHHATPTTAMGFCLFNNVAIAAAHVIERRGLERVAVVDIDVHHGNGTQDAFYSDPRVLYFSTHQHPFYPGTGGWQETGEGEGRGTTVNVPLPRGCSDEEYMRAYGEICARVVRRFRPQLLLVSAGFDAHHADPLAQEMLSVRGYFEIAMLLKELADELCGGKIVYALEGGYDHTAIAWAAQACVDTLLGNEFAGDPIGPAPNIQRPDIDGLMVTIQSEHGL
jgi:acetoin utilization deacetylase AcuC-like enzyme